MYLFVKETKEEKNQQALTVSMCLCGRRRASLTGSLRSSAMDRMAISRAALFGSRSVYNVGSQVLVGQMNETVRDEKQSA